jgi:serine/threonine protein kinase
MPPRPMRASACSNEDLAMVVASCQGEVTNVMYPWVRAVTLNLNTGEEFDEGPPPKSPYYFIGVYEGKEVFIKVWVEGEKSTCLKDIASEIKMQQDAYKNGVPCPGVIDHLTALSKTFRQKTFHLLVMPKAENDSLDRADLGAYAKSLIQAVIVLHEAGLLHCDIKPNNVTWNDTTKAVSLVDFEHAQKSNCAKSYMGTDGYTAPEVTKKKKEVHSRLTDAYGVGKTLMQAAGKNRKRPHDSPPNSCPVRLVAERLSCEESANRMSLEEALRFLDGQETVSSETKVAPGLAGL